jgi:hypothetical protein
MVVQFVHQYRTGGLISAEASPVELLYEDRNDLDNSIYFSLSEALR